MAVHSQFRERGLGGFLLDGLLEEARTGAGELIVLEVESSNAVAVALYLSRGFNKVRYRKDYYGKGNGADVMEWRA